MKVVSVLQQLDAPSLAIIPPLAMQQNADETSVLLNLPADDNDCEYRYIACTTRIIRFPTHLFVQMRTRSEDPDSAQVLVKRPPLEEFSQSMPPRSRSRNFDVAVRSGHVAIVAAAVYVIQTRFHVYMCKYARIHVPTTRDMQKQTAHASRI
jgi:hypothetical protein